MAHIARHYRSLKDPDRFRPMRLTIIWNWISSSRLSSDGFVLNQMMLLLCTTDQRCSNNSSGVTEVGKMGPDQKHP